MHPSDDMFYLYVREKQLLLAGTAMWLAKQAADKAAGREVQDHLIDHMYNCHHADLLLQQFIEYRQYSERKLSEYQLALSKRKIAIDDLKNEVEKLRKIIEDTLWSRSLRLFKFMNALKLMV